MTVVVNASTNPDIDGILWGWAWGDGGAETLTYSFPTATTEYTNGGYVAINGFSAFNAAQQTAARNILANIASFCNLTFTETTAAGASLRFADATAVNYTNNSSVATHTGLHDVPTAEANPPELAFNGTAPYSPLYTQGDSWYNGYTTPQLGSFQYAAGLMHETGHNLGLKHGHITQAGHGVTFPTLPADHDSYEYSVMTYRQFPGDNIDIDNAPHHPTTYMQDDIAALQYLYGANYGPTAQNGNTVYTWSPTTGEEFIDGVGQGAPSANFVLMTLWDGGGTDTYNLSNYTTDLSVDLNPGAWTIFDTSTARAQRADLSDYRSGGTTYFARGNVANALLFQGDTRSLIENAIGGSGDDVFNGNSTNNGWTGGTGNDTADGEGGTDTAIFSGARADYNTSLIGASVQIADLRLGDPDGTDVLSNFEFFRFSNRTYTLAEVLNQPPVAASDSNGIAKNSTLNVQVDTGVLANDSDDNNQLVVSAVKGSQGNVGHVVTGTYGSLTLNADGSYVYVANRGSLPAKIVAQDAFTYTVSDEIGGTDTATLSVVVFNPGASYASGANTTLPGGNGQDVLDGSAGNVVARGGNGRDVLIAGNGNTLTGGNGPDTFLLRPEFGSNVITDFNINNDAIQFDQSIFAATTDLFSHTSDTAAGAFINDNNGNTLTLAGVTLAQMQAHANSFYFV
jgi:VCBS repeat-containing protein